MSDESIPSIGLLGSTYISTSEILTPCIKWNSIWKANKVYPPLIPPMICRETCGHCRLIKDQTDDELCCNGKMCFNEGYLNTATCECICPFGGRSIDCKSGLTGPGLVLIDYSLMACEPFKSQNYRIRKIFQF